MATKCAMIPWEGEATWLPLKTLTSKVAIPLPGGGSLELLRTHLYDPTQPTSEAKLIPVYASPRMNIDITRTKLYLLLKKDLA